MSSVKIELNGAGIRSLLSSGETAAMLKGKADRVAAAVKGAGITVGATQGGGEVPLPVDVVMASGSRARALVVVDHPAALNAEAKYRVLAGSLTAAHD